MNTIYRTLSKKNKKNKKTFHSYKYCMLYLLVSPVLLNHCQFEFIFYYFCMCLKKQALYYFLPSSPVVDLQSWSRLIPISSEFSTAGKNKNKKLCGSFMFLFLFYIKIKSFPLHIQPTLTLNIEIQYLNHTQRVSHYKKICNLDKRVQQFATALTTILQLYTLMLSSFRE